MSDGNDPVEGVDSLPTDAEGPKKPLAARESTAHDGYELEEDDRRPTPVRQGLEGSEGEENPEVGERRVFPDHESGEEWLVTVAGRSSSGIFPLRTVPVMELHFALLDTPEAPLRRVLCQGKELEDLRDDELFSFFQGSEPIPSPRQEGQASDSRPKKGKGRRKPGS